MPMEKEPKESGGDFIKRCIPHYIDKGQSRVIDE